MRTPNAVRRCTATAWPRWRRRLVLVAGTLGLVMATLAVAAPGSALASSPLFASQAGSGTQNCSSVANACTLATALSNAASSSGAVTIDLAAGTYAPISIASGSESSLVIDGAGSGASLISGASSTQTASLDVPSTLPITLENLGLTAGHATGSEGGNLDIEEGNVTLNDTVVSGGTTNEDGGGLSVTDATVTIDDTTVSGNTASGGVGGGVMIFGDSTVTVEDSTVSGNTAGTNGAGIDLQAASTLGVYDSTIADNIGEALLSTGTGVASLYGSTVVGNAKGINLESGGTAVLGGDVLDDNGGDDCFVGTPTNEGYDYADDTTCSGFSGTSHDDEGAALAVGALATNSGPTQTAAVTSASVAYDVVPIGVTLTGDPKGALCAGDDQRGVSRTQGPAGGCSAGAFQYAPPVVTGVSPRAALEPGLPATLTGYGFANVTNVTFGSTPVALTGQTADSLSFNVPLSLSLGSEPIGVTNPDGTTTTAFTAVGSPAIATATLAPGQYSAAYSQSLAVAGGAAPYSFTLTSGALPVGLTLSGSGVVSGAPTRPGGTAFGVQVTDANGITSPSSTVSLVIATPIVSIKSSEVVILAGSFPVTLACAGAPCAGKLSLTETLTVHVKHKLKPMTFVLAATPYSVPAGQSAIATLTLTQAAARTLKHVKKHPREETLNASLSAGSSESRTVKVS